jgi:hypothetical protein
MSMEAPMAEGAMVRRNRRSHLERGEGTIRDWVVRLTHGRGLLPARPLV